MGQRFIHGCRKCRRGEFKHSKCGRWVTAQYGFCPKCYPERLLPKPRIKKLSKPKGTMPKGYGQDTRYVFTDKPTMPKGWETRPQ
jgi:hypothetical protein